MKEQEKLLLEKITNVIHCGTNIDYEKQWKNVFCCDDGFSCCFFMCRVACSPVFLHFTIRQINPLGLIYKGHIDNPYERAHITIYFERVGMKGLSYHLTSFEVKKQTSSYTNYEVEVFRESDINSLLFSYGYPMVQIGFWGRNVYSVLRRVN